MPDFNFEKKLIQPVVGVDEVGRGSLVGPVVSCACFFLDYYISNEDIKKINDSKKLSHLQRIKALGILLKMEKQKKFKYCIGSASVKEIDNFNILNATILSMKRAVKKLNLNKGTIIVDGNISFNIKNMIFKNIIKGDQKSISIASSSIIAKVYRDNYMKQLGKKFPLYNWAQNSGYGTLEHRNQIKLYKITPHHRKSFNPIKTYIQKKN